MCFELLTFVCFALCCCDLGAAQVSESRATEVCVCVCVCVCVFACVGARVWQGGEAIRLISSGLPAAEPSRSVALQQCRDNVAAWVASGTAFAAFSCFESLP